MLVTGVRLLVKNRTDAALEAGLYIAANGPPILRRAHAARLRSLHRHRPELPGVTDLAALIDVHKGQ